MTRALQVASAQTHREWNHTDIKAPWKPCLRGGFNLGSAPGTDHRDESDQRLLLALLFVLRKRLENRRLPIMHTRDWKTNLKGQDLFSKIITIIKQKISTHKNIKKISKIKKNTKKKITIAAFPGLISARRTKVISKKQLRVSIAHTNLLKIQNKPKGTKTTC